MGVCKPMFGFDGKETKNLRARYRKIRDDCEWPSIEAFLLWAKESGYKTGMYLRKYGESLPHGPENSFWNTKTSQGAKQRYIESLKNNCEFCNGCQEDCPKTGLGCKEWADYWKENWNKNIYVPPVKPPEPVKQQFFCYEHPDLVREGIVFEGSGSM